MQLNINFVSPCPSCFGFLKCSKEAIVQLIESMRGTYLRFPLILPFNLLLSFYGIQNEIGRGLIPQNLPASLICSFAFRAPAGAHALLAGRVQVSHWEFYSARCPAAPLSHKHWAEPARGMFALWLCLLNQKVLRMSLKSLEQWLSNFYTSVSQGLT